VIEERARGDWSVAAAIRERLEGRIGGSIRRSSPAPAAAASLKEALIEDGLWSQYLEVAIGPTPKVFTKSPGALDRRRRRRDRRALGFDLEQSEPEVALLVDSAARRSARRSATTSTCAISRAVRAAAGQGQGQQRLVRAGPVVRPVRRSFSIDDVRSATVHAAGRGRGRLRARGASNMAEISRDPLELVRQALSEHQYPDGFVLFLGTLFAPVQDRDHPGAGSPTRSGTGWRSPARSSGGWSTGWSRRATRRRGRRASAR
jgi:fumarylacetoacetate (FAA) hydrolase family protein